MGVDANWVRSEPSTRTRDPTSLEMQTTVPRQGRVTEDTRHRLGLDHPRQELLGRGVAVGINVCPRGDGPAQSFLRRSQATSLHSHLACETADGFPDRDRPQSPVGFAKSHDRSTTNVRPDRFRNLAPEKETDHFSEEPKEQVRRGWAHRITHMRRTEAGPSRTRGRREGPKGLADLIHVSRRGSTRGDPAQSVHLNQVTVRRRGVEKAERGDYILRGPNPEDPEATPRKHDEEHSPG